MPFDAVSLLKADHHRIKRLFERFGAQGSVSNMKVLVQTICDQLTIYLAIKEEIIYPSLCHANRARPPMAELDESVVEHFTLKIIMEALDGQAPDDPLFMAKVHILKRHFIRHVEDDERCLLPELRSLAIVDLSRQIHKCRSELEYQGLSSKELIMPYDNKSDLPDSVRDNLPSHAQEIYLKAFNSAWDEYRDPEDRRDDASREETAHKVAWAAVKNEYHKEGDQWVKDKS